METQVQAAGEGKANFIQTFTLDQWSNMLISKSQEIDRKNRDWKIEDAKRVKDRADEMSRKQKELKTAQDGYTAAGGDLKTLEIPPIQ